MTDKSKPDAPVRRLSDIVREAKIGAAERTDVVVDMRDADRARLELLAQELKPVFDDIDPADDRFDFGVSQGLQPRLWVDAVVHVHMGADRRVFRLVRDTRLGRVVISDTSDLSATADAVTRYIAERVIERERILAGDFESMKDMVARPVGVADQHRVGDGADGKTGGNAGAKTGGRGAGGKVTVKLEPATLTPMAAATSAKPTDNGSASGRQQGAQASAAGVSVATTSVPPKSSGNGGIGLGASWFVLGSVAGVAALMAAFWDRLSALLN